jgi:hypothetical protein
MTNPLRRLFLIPLLVCASISVAEDAKPPTSVDLRPELEKLGLSVRGQGARPTCSVFTVVGALEFAASRKLDQTQRLSVEYLNWASDDVVGKAQDGGFFSDLWRGFTRHGVCLEEVMPYAKKFKRSAAPDPAAAEAAKKAAELGLQFHWIKEWNVKTGLTAEQTAEIKRTLASGWPVCGGFRWPNREEWKDGVLQMRESSEVYDGHSVLLIGYKDDAALPGGGAYLIRNSDGKGNESWMPYAYAANFMNDAAWIDYGIEKK